MGPSGIKRRRVDMPSQLFMTKPHSVLLEELRGEHRLRRVLGPVQLSSLGVGAIIGTGIFVLVGIAAHDRAGPALMLSFVAAGVTCIFAALCYAEFASMVPVAGSAYTYAYATLGELFAWIIGWDLILEYAVASSTVAHGWSHYFQDLLAFFNVRLPHAVTNAPFDFDPTSGRLALTGTWFDLPAIFIAALVTVILVKGIKESASFNAAIVILKVAIVFFVIGLGAHYVNPANWRPFAPFGLTGLSLFGRGHHISTSGDDVEPAENLPGYGAGRAASARILRCRPRALPHALEVDHFDWSLRCKHGCLPAFANPGRTCEHRHAACVRDCMRCGFDYAANPSRGASPLPGAVQSHHACAGDLVLLDPDVLAARRELVAARSLAGCGPDDLFHLRAQT